MQIAIPLLIVLVVLAVAAVLALRALDRRSREAQSAVSGADRTLEYVVPEGEDPLAIVLALREHDLAAVSHGDRVLVALRDPAQRDSARRVIESAPANAEEDPSARPPVRFSDE